MSAAGMAWNQFRFERKMFWRNPSAAFFSFLLPVLFLVLIASVYGATAKDLEILEPGLAGMAVMSTTFIALTYSVTFNREQGILKRVRGTPLPPGAYFAGVIGNAVANAVLQVALVIAVGHLAYGGDLPRNWIELIVFTIVGVATFASLGMAFAQVIPNFDSAPAYTNAVFLPMIFISGVFYSSRSLPAALDVIAKVLPLRHVVDGLHAALVTGASLADSLDALGILFAWLAVGLFATFRFFRWEA
ncbi:MAG: type transport system permease protein [Thermoleophilaceae bacterium]|jgi:ABC-2 type transport system permease protein|nr:type transport system permease protein [Thermoleophilaceae bacterium]